MALTFDGTLDSINEDVLKACSKFFEKQGVNDGKVNVEVVGQKGDNYVAIVRRFVVQNGHPEKPMKMVVKIAPTDAMAREMMQVVQMFNNEALVYNRILPKYQQYEKSADVPKDNRLRSPKCLGVNLEPPHECIALEDLGLHGFSIADRLKSLTDDEIKLILNDLAKFHALGFVLKERDNAMFEEMKTKLQNMWGYYDKSEEFKQFLYFIGTQVDSVLDSDDYKKRVKGIMSTFATTAKNLSKSDLSSKHTIIIQGDCWTNNFMYRREDGKPVEAIMLDYQLARVSSPVVDLHYLIFNCTDSETRANRYYEWLDYYYDNFAKYLGNFDIKANYVYPRDKFDADLQRYAKNGLGLVFILSSMLVRESEEVIDYKEGGFDMTSANVQEEMEKNLSVSTMKESSARRFKERIQGTVKDFISYGYI